MNFPFRLASALKDASEEEDGNELQGLYGWNDEIEPFLASGGKTLGTTDDSSSSEGKLTTTTTDDIQGVCLNLEKGLMNYAQEFEHDNNVSSGDTTRPNETITVNQKLFEFVRTSKNLLRWYIQIYIAEKGQVLSSPIATLQSPKLIELLVKLLKETSRSIDGQHQEFARNICLYLFYATYISFPQEPSTQKALHHLFHNLHFQDTALRVLVGPCTAALALATVRIVHSAVATLQGATHLVTGSQWTLETQQQQDSLAPWVPEEEGNRVVTFRSICVDILHWALFSSKPPFPGDDEEDKRGELVVEILGFLYAMRIGAQLIPTSCDPRMMQLVCKMLKSPPENEDKRVEQCRLSTVSLLMDSHVTFASYLMDHEALTPLLEILTTQVEDTLENTKVDNSAAASLVPILVVLNKFSGGDAAFQKSVKLYIFPADAEAAFQEKVKTAQEASGESSKSNMSPLDAPKGSLRWKLISLMTWPESHIKRCTGELLWTLCSSDANEFVHRVGFGNALPLLASKGLAQLPAGV